MGDHDQSSYIKLAVDPHLDSHPDPQEAGALPDLALPPTSESLHNYVLYTKGFIDQSQDDFTSMAKGYHHYPGQFKKLMDEIDALQKKIDKELFDLDQGLQNARNQSSASLMLNNANTRIHSMTEEAQMKLATAGIAAIGG